MSCFTRQRKTSSRSVRQLGDIAAGHREEYWSILILDKGNAMDVMRMRFETVFLFLFFGVLKDDVDLLASKNKGNWNHQPTRILLGVQE